MSSSPPIIWKNLHVLEERAREELIRFIDSDINNKLFIFFLFFLLLLFFIRSSRRSVTLTLVIIIRRLWLASLLSGPLSKPFRKLG